MTSGPTDSGRMTVQGLLDEPLLADARVLAGQELLDQELTWVLPLNEVLSQPDSLESMAVYTRPEALVGRSAVLSALAARGATTLLIDGDGPADLLEHDLPCRLVIIELGIPVGFAALNRLLAERALSQEVHVMRYSTHVHSSLAGLFHRGAGLRTLIREVSNLSHHPAMALDVRGHVVAHNGLAADALPTLTDSVCGLLSVELPASARHHAGHDTRVQQVPGPHDTVWTVVATAIRLGKNFEGWVVILVPDADPGIHNLARHTVLTEQATAIIGSEMLRQRSVDEAEERARGDFVQALVHGSFSSAHDMRVRAEYHDIEIDTYFGVFVAPGVLPEDSPAANVVRLARYAAGVAWDAAVHTYVTAIGDVLVIVRTLRGEHDPARCEEMADYAEAMSAELEHRRGVPAPVAYGRPAQGAEEVPDRYREARVALGIARRLQCSGATSYQELRSFIVLADVADTEPSRHLVREALTPLRASTGLLETLSAYLSHGGNVNATARALDVHRNTMLAKLDRISRLLGMDIRVPENQFTAWLAIRLDVLQEVNSAVDREISFR